MIQVYIEYFCPACGQSNSEVRTLPFVPETVCGECAGKLEIELIDELEEK